MSKIIVGESFFMGKPSSYWLRLEETFGHVQDDPYVLLVAAEAKIALLDSKYENDKLLLQTEITNLRNQLGFVNGE
jgi:hypothetical protein